MLFLTFEMAGCRVYIYCVKKEDVWLATVHHGVLVRGNKSPTSHKQGSQQHRGFMVQWCFLRWPPSITGTLGSGRSGDLACEWQYDFSRTVDG